MNTTGHYVCSSRPRTVQEESQLAAAAAALFSSAARRLNDLEVGYVGDVLASRAVGEYDKLAGLDTGDKP